MPIIYSLLVMVLILLIAYQHRQMIYKNIVTKNNL
jgi:hypothetical protein